MSECSWMTRGGGEKKGRKNGTKGENSKKSKTESDICKVTYRNFVLQTTHVNEMDKWNLCLRPRNMTKDFGGKERAVTVQYGRS